MVFVQKNQDIMKVFRFPTKTIFVVTPLFGE